jgi:protein-S-isoprenylcysteine O-methyltransferase
VIRTALLGLAFGASELLLGLRRRAARAQAVPRDSGTLALVWIVIGATVPLAVWTAEATRLGRFELGSVGQLGALALFLGGLALRWWAIVTLGRFFTVDVAIHNDHRLVTRGPYRFLRHPSYTGLLAAFAGLGLTLGSWPALAVLGLPLTAVLLRRIQVEEGVMSERFGAEWSAYASRVRRLLPFLW